MNRCKFWSVLFLIILACFFTANYSSAAVNITKNGTNIIDEESSSFEKDCDNGDWWWSQSVGHNGHMYWTYAIDDSIDAHYGCYGKWNMNIVDNGNYEVFVHIPSNYATSKQAEYKIWRAVDYNDYKSSYKTIDQSIYYNEWVSLGTYYFHNGSAAVRLDDYTGESYTYLKRKLGYDAVKLVNMDPAEKEADLIVQNMDVNPTTVEAGAEISVSCEVKNQGDGSADSSTLKYYLSSNTRYDSSDTELANDYVTSLSSGRRGSENADLTIPSDTDAGTYYILFYADADGEVSESDEGNNVGYNQITVKERKPDLIIQNQAVSSATVKAGDEISASCEVKNGGGGSANSSTLKYYLSSDTDYGWSDTYLEDDYVKSLSSNGTSSETADLTIPSGTDPGTYYILFYADADGEVSESNEGNNVSYKKITVQSVDTERPSIRITAPTTTSTYSTTESLIDISGTASDNVDVTQVKWSNSRGGSGVASGAESWSEDDIPLYDGENIITVTAYDASGKNASDTLTVTKQLPVNQKPTVMISSPFDNETFTTPDIIVSGTANDIDGSVTFVVIRVNVGSWVTVNGTTNWSYEVTLKNGSNQIEAKALDNKGEYSLLKLVTVNFSDDTSSQLNVPLYGQRGEYWSNDQLGTCYPETIGSHGCAVSSAAMVFKYYGVNTNPRDLNNWLTQNNGYDEGCLIDWGVAANYTEGKVQWIDSISYRTQPADLNKIKSELDNGYPVIAEMCNDVGPLKPYYHFVVITGYSGSSFYINDPWFNESNTISARYGDPARAICGIRIYHGEADTSNVALTKGIWVFENDPNTYPIEYGQWLDGQFTVKNYGNEAITFKRIGIGGRAPISNGGNPDSNNIYDLGFETDVTLQPNEEKQLWFHQDSFGKNGIWGKYRLTAYYQLPDNSWHEIPSGEPDTGASYDFQVVQHASPSVLSNGLGKDGYVPRGGYDHFYIDLPDKASELEIKITGTRNGDYIDLYEQSGSSYPTTSSYDNKSDMASSDETITVDNPSPGKHTILVDGKYEDGDPERGSLYRITVTYKTETLPPQTETITKPGMPIGETSPIIGRNYLYQTSGASSNLGHQLEYQFYWGDGTGSGWSMAKQAYHTWQNIDNGISRSVTVEARCTQHPEKTNTSQNLLVTPEAEDEPPADEDITITKASPSLVTVGAAKKEIRDSWFDLIVEGTNFSSGNLGVYIPGVCLGDKNSGDCDSKAVLISDTKLKVTVKEVYGSSLEGYRYVGIIDLNASADNNELARNERIFSAVDPKNVAILKRTSIGGQISEAVTWNVEFKDEYASEFGIGSYGTSFELITRNLKLDDWDSSPKVLMSSAIEHKFNDTGVHSVKLRAINNRGTIETPEILQLVAPSLSEINDNRGFINTSELEDRVINKSRPNEVHYDVIVIGGTSAGVGAAITAARERDLSILWIERTDLLGGMFTNGIGISDIELHPFWDKDRLKLSSGLMEDLRRKVLDTYESGIDDEKESSSRGLEFRPSVIRGALYELIEKELDKNESKTKKFHIKLQSSVSGIERSNGEFKVTMEGEDVPYRSKYIIDATDSGDAAIMYAENIGIDMTAEHDSESRDCSEDTICSDIDCSVPPSDSTQAGYRIRRPTQAYSYVMTIQDHNGVDHWSHMIAPPPRCGNEGEYTTRALFEKEEGEYPWTYNRGWLTCNPNEDGFNNCEPKKFQVKHHKKLGTYPRGDGKECPRLGYELIDSMPYNFSVKSGYAESSEEDRIEIRDRYLDHSLCFLYKMQNLGGGSGISGIENSHIGLTTDEDPLRGNFPTRIYVREGRRINGKATFTKCDAYKSSAYGRPKQYPSITQQGIAVVTYTMDSHVTDPTCISECSYFLNKNTGLGVIPLGVMIPNGLPNLLVALAVSSTHEGYGTLRMDPTRLYMGQAASLAISVAEENGIKLDTLMDEKKANVLFEMQKRLVRDYGGRIFLYKDDELSLNSGWYDKVEGFLKQETEEKDSSMYEALKAIKALPDNEPVKMQWVEFNALNMATQFLGVWQVAQGYYDRGNGKCGNEDCNDENCYKFLPNNPVSRAEMVKMLLMASPIHPNEQDFYDSYNGNSECAFSDVGDHWAKGYINYAKDKGIVSCKDGKDFKPDDLINRAEIAKMVFKAFNSFERQINSSELETLKDRLIDKGVFSDITNRDVWYLGPVTALNHLGIMEGYDKTKFFRPEFISKRGDAAIILFRAICVYNGLNWKG